MVEIIIYAVIISFNIIWIMTAFFKNKILRKDKKYLDILQKIILKNIKNVNVNNKDEYYIKSMSLVVMSCLLSKYETAKISEMNLTLFEQYLNNCLCDFIEKCEFKS